MKRAAILAAILAVLISTATFAAQAPIPGLDAHQSELVLQEGSRLFDVARAEFEAGHGAQQLSVEDVVCGTARMMQGRLAGTLMEVPNLSAGQVASVKRAINYLQGVVDKNCERPKGGGDGSGNAGDRIVQAWASKHAPTARNVLEEMRDKLRTVSGVDVSRAARDVVLAAALVAAGLATAPLWAL